MDKFSIILCLSIGARPAWGSARKPLDVSLSPELFRCGAPSCRRLVLQIIQLDVSIILCPRTSHSATLGVTLIDFHYVQTQWTLFRKKLVFAKFAVMKVPLSVPRVWKRALLRNSMKLQYELYEPTKCIAQLASPLILSANQGAYFWFS